jgi:hypothetical protein
MDLTEFNTKTMKDKLNLTEHFIIYEGIDERDNEGNPFLLTIVYRHRGNNSVYMVQIEADMESWYEALEIFVAPAALEALYNEV